MSDMREVQHRALVVLLSVAIAACGNVTAGGVGDTEVYMSGDQSPSGAPVVTAPSEAAGSVPRPSFDIVGAGLEGDVEVTATLSIRRDDGAVFDLTPAGAFETTLDLGGANEPRVAARPLPEGRYDSLTVTFTDVTAVVTGGLEIDGLPFLGPVSVDLDVGGVTVTRPVDLTLVADGLVAVVVDLNADAWVPLVEVLTGTVTALEFGAAVIVSER